LNILSYEALEQVADDFSTLPLLFLNFYGASDIDMILEAMDYAVYRDDVTHIILG
jgi:twinkle protein